MRGVMKSRKHHNNTGYRQIKRGKTREQVKRIAKRLGIPYGEKDTEFMKQWAKDMRDAL